jgi:hypothetical protein
MASSVDRIADMSTPHGNRAWWLFAVLATVLVWLIGAYVPALSNFWVELNLITPAGRPHLAVLPLDYPAVGIDVHTLCSLSGVVVIVAAVTRWISYFERHTPPAPDQGSGQPPLASPALVAPPVPN